jgi:hypothetical protein
MFVSTRLFEVMKRMGRKDEKRKEERKGGRGEEEIPPKKRARKGSKGGCRKGRGARASTQCKCE